MRLSEWFKDSLDNVLDKVIDYRGQSVPKSESGIPLITARNVREGYLDFSAKEFVGEEEYQNWMSRGVPQAGDVLITTEAPLGMVAMYPCDNQRYAVGQRTITLRPSKKINAKYLMYYLIGPARKEIQERASGSTAKGIKSSELKKISISFPSVEEQEKIAKILSTWDDAIALSQKYLDKMSLLVPYLLRNIFKDCNNWTDVKDVSLMISKGTTPTTYGHNYTTSGVNFIRVENITETGTLDLCNVKFISEETHNLLQRSILRKGDVLFSIAGAIGRTTVIEDAYLPANTNQAVAFIRPDSTIINSDYLRLALQLHAGNKYIAQLQTGNAQKNFNLEQVGSISIPIANLDKQASIATKALNIYSCIESIGQYINCLKQQKQGLMQQLLTGKKRVQFELGDK